MADKKNFAEELARKNRELRKSLGKREFHKEEIESRDLLGVSKLENKHSKRTFNKVLSEHLNETKSIYDELKKSGMLVKENDQFITYKAFQTKFLALFNEYITNHPSEFDDNKSKRFDPETKYVGKENIYMGYYSSQSAITSAFKHVAATLVVPVDEKEDNKLEVREAIDKIVKGVDEKINHGMQEYANKRADTYANFLAQEVSNKMGVNVSAIYNREYEPKEGEAIDFNSAFSFSVPVGSRAPIKLKAKDEALFNQYDNFIKECMVNEKTTLTPAEKERNNKLFDGLIDDFMRQTIYSLNADIVGDVQKQLADDYMRTYIQEHVAEFSSATPDMLDLVNGKVSAKIAPDDLDKYNELRKIYLSSPEFDTSFKSAMETYNEKITSVITSLSIQANATSTDRYGIELGAVSGSLNKDTYSIIINGRPLREIVEEQLRRSEVLLNNADISKKIELSKDNGFIYKQFVTSLSFCEDKMFFPLFIERVLAEDEKLKNKAALKTMNAISQERNNKDIILNGHFAETGSNAKEYFEGIMATIAEDLTLEPEDAKVYSMESDEYANDTEIFVGYRDDLSGICTNIAVVDAMFKNPPTRMSKADHARLQNVKKMDMTTVNLERTLFSERAGYDLIKYKSELAKEEINSVAEEFVSEKNKQREIDSVNAEVAGYALMANKNIKARISEELNSIADWSLVLMNENNLNDKELFVNSVKWNEAKLACRKDADGNEVTDTLQINRNALHKYFEKANTDEINKFCERISVKMLRTNSLDSESRVINLKNCTKSSMKSARDGLNRAMQLNNTLSKDIDNIIMQYKTEESWKIFIELNPQFKDELTARRLELIELKILVVEPEKEEEKDIEQQIKEEASEENDLRVRSFSFNSKELHMIANSFKKKHLNIGPAKFKTTFVKEDTPAISEPTNTFVLEPVRSVAYTSEITGERGKANYTEIYRNVDLSALARVDKSIVSQVNDPNTSAVLDAKFKAYTDESAVSDKPKEELQSYQALFGENGEIKDADAVIEYTKTALYSLKLINHNIPRADKLIDNGELTFAELVTMGVGGEFSNDAVTSEDFVADYAEVEKEIAELEKNIINMEESNKDATACRCMMLLSKLGREYGVEGNSLTQVLKTFSQSLVDSNSLLSEKADITKIDKTVDLTTKADAISCLTVNETSEFVNVVNAETNQANVVQEQALTNEANVVQEQVVNREVNIGAETLNYIDKDKRDADGIVKGRQFPKGREYALNVLIEKINEAKSYADDKDNSFINKIDFIIDETIDKKDSAVRLMEEYNKIKPIIDEFESKKGQNVNSEEYYNRIVDVLGVKKADGKSIDVKESKKSSLVFNCMSNIALDYYRAMNTLELGYTANIDSTNGATKPLNIDLDELVKDIPGDKNQAIINVLEYIIKNDESISSGQMTIEQVLVEIQNNLNKTTEMVN